MQPPIYNTVSEFNEHFENDYFKNYAPLKYSFYDYLNDCKSAYENYIFISNKHIGNCNDFVAFYIENSRVLTENLNFIDNDDEINGLNNIIGDNFFKISEYQNEINIIKGEIEESQKIMSKIIAQIEILKDRLKNGNFINDGQSTKTQTFEIPEIVPYSKEIGKGKNIPYKLALLRELGFLDILNKKYSNNSEQLYRILDYLTGGNSKNYYLSMYGTDYNGKDKVTRSHTAHLRENDLI